MYQMSVSLKQKQNDWQFSPVTIAGVTVTKDAPQNDHWVGYSGLNGRCTISNKNTSGLKFNWIGGSEESSGGSSDITDNNILTNGDFSMN